MGMNNSYSAYYNKLKEEDRYKKFIEDADSKKVYYENIKERYDKYVHDWYWSWTTLPHEVILDYFFNSDEAGKYARPKVKADEPKVNESTLESQTINVDAVRNYLRQYQEVVDNISSISCELELLKEKLGRKKLYVDNKGYEIRIEELIDKIDKTYKKPMQEFVDAVNDRAQFVHDFQLCVGKDYYRYFGKYGPWYVKKTWSRKDSGWSL